MEPATVATSRRLPTWVSGLVPLAVLAVAIAAFVALGAPGLDRNGVPVEDITVERTELHVGEITLHLRNSGPDEVTIAQAIVNDAFVPFETEDPELGRLEGGKISIPYPWVEGEAYQVQLLTSTGGTVDTTIDVAAESPTADFGFLGLMVLIGLYVGIIPVAIGMLWLPWIRRVDQRWIRLVLALTIGLLAFLGIDALLEGSEIAAGGAGAFGGAALVWLGALISYFVLAGVDAGMRARGERARAAGASGFTLALLVAIGVGLHNLGEGLAIGSAYAVGSLALGASLVVGFALHNTTEGLAIVAPAAGAPIKVRRLVLLGLVAGAPAILGAVIGATAFNAGVAAFLFGLGAGAIAQVIVQIAPSLRNRDGRLIDPIVAGGVLAGLVLMYATSLLISL